MKKTLLASCCLLFSCHIPILEASLENLDINGFLSVGGAWSSVDYIEVGVDPTFVSTIDDRPSFDKDSDVGIQITKALHSNVSVTAEFLGQGFEDFDVGVSLAFLKYEPNEKWQYRVGRLRTQPLIFSEVIYVGYAYPWIRPPQEVYILKPNVFRQFTGVDVQYKMQILCQDLVWSAFYGAATTPLSLPNALIFPNSQFFPAPLAFTTEDTIKLKMRDVGSFSLKYGDETFNIHLGYETLRMTAEPNFAIFPRLNRFLDTQIAAGNLGSDYENFYNLYQVRTSLTGVGYQFDWKNIVSMGEWAKRHSATPVVASAIGWYLMGGYRVNNLLPHITFSRQRVEDNWTRRFPGVVNQAAITAFGATLDDISRAIISTNTGFEGGVGDETSLTIGLRWDIYEGIAIKSEWQHVHPDNHSRGLFNLHPHKSVNLYSLGLDAVI